MTDELCDPRDHERGGSEAREPHGPGARNKPRVISDIPSNTTDIPSASTGDNRR